MAWQLAALAALLIGAGTAEGATRRYFIQAEKVWWNFAEDSEAGLYIDKCTGNNYTDGAELYMQMGAGSRYYHARYIAYTDETFTTPAKVPAEEVHLGITGPLLRVAVGDQLEVVFSNTLEFDANLNPSGVELSENDTEAVPANETKTYNWNITERISPGANETSSKVWIYLSTVDPFVHQNMGLIGGMIVTRADAATASGRPNDVDLELFAMFHVFDENINTYFNETLLAYNLTDPLVQANVSEGMWEEANLMHSINGKMFCWNDGMTIPEGKRAKRLNSREPPFERLRHNVISKADATDYYRVRWHIVDVGGEPDIHNFHWHGMVLNFTGTFVDQFSAFAGSTFDADMVTDNPGTWLFHCHINDHIHAGMIGFYTLEGTPINKTDQGDVQQYFIAANEVEWDYTPMNMDMCGSTPQNLSEDAMAQLTPSNFSLNIGSKQMKALFEEYTDATFTTKKDKDPTLGLVGPTIRAKVGDTIKVTFKNNARFTTSLHPHGVLYAKSSEGSPYDDGTSAADKVDDYVHTGQTWNYTWYVTERSAPGPSDGSSVVWMYHSHSHEIQDSYAGLMGAIIVTTKDMATKDNRPKDVTKEYILMFSIINEASSFMLRANLEKYLPGIPNLQYGSLLDSVPDFATNMNMHSINGYMYCNGPSFNATVGDHVRFYIMTLGTEADLHTPDSSLQWVRQGRRQSTLINIAGDMQTADVTPVVAGDFTLQCKTNEHVDGGMLSIFHVESSKNQSVPKRTGIERTTYIAATEETWDYIPSGSNKCTGEEFDEDTAAQWGDDTMGHTFIKAVYREYSDDDFLTRVKPRNPSDGIAGPTLRGEVGDVITVVYMNNASFPNNLQLGGGFMPLHNESLIDTPVESGNTVTYSWLVTESNGPAINDVSTVAYAYRSNADYSADLNAGLYGAVVVARKGELQSNGLPKGVDYEIPLFFNIIDESGSSLFDANLAFTNFTAPDEVYDYDVWAAWAETTSWQTINGYSWCHQEDVQLNVSSTVRWILVGLGGEVSLHTPEFTNAVLLAEGNVVYTTELAPSVSMVVDMRADYEGTWEYRCNVQEHYEGGMIGKFVITDPTKQRTGGNAS